MPKIVVNKRNGASNVVEAATGVSLMECVREVGGLLALCGGSPACATCHVYIDPLWMAKAGVATSVEDALLQDSVHRQTNSRLSCQIRVTDALDGLKLSIPPEE